MWFAWKCAPSVVPPTILIGNPQLKEVHKQRIIFGNGVLSYVLYAVQYHTTYLYLLSLHWKSLSYDVLNMLIESLVFSMLYLSGVFLLYNKSQITRLTWLQNRSVCVTKWFRTYDHVSELCQQLNWLSVSAQMFKSTCTIFRYYHNNITCHAWFSIHWSYLDNNITITHVAKIALPICKLVISPPPKNSFVHLPLHMEFSDECHVCYIYIVH